MSCTIRCRSPQCCCARYPDLNRDGGKAPSKECDLTCSGSKTRGKCGGHYRMSVYSMPLMVAYVGCYGDRTYFRAMPGAGRYTDAKTMGNHVSPPRWAKGQARCVSDPREVSRRLLPGA